MAMLLLGFPSVTNLLLILPSVFFRVIPWLMLLLGFPSVANFLLILHSVNK